MKGENMKKRMLAAVLAFCVAGASLVGCGSGNSSGSTSAPADGSTAAASEEAPAQKTQRDLELDIVIGIAQDLDQSLDPHYTV